MNVLIADDSRTIRMLVKRNLKQVGYEDATVFEAADGAEALEIARREQLDLILSDWNMPGVSGLQLLRTLRDDGDGTVFGFITSESTPTYRDQAVAAGAAFVLSKPFNAQTFADAMGTAVR